jgi:DNA-binding protein HU-beta
MMGMYFSPPQETPMNKAELVDAVALKSELTKVAAAKAVDAVLATITETVAKGDTVSVIGFGSFEARKRAARNGKNPKTGEAIKIAATTVPAFKAGKAFKDKVAAKKASKKK